MDGVTVTPLKIINNPKGDILHALKCSETSFSSFGEAYFSIIKEQEIKGWKKHHKMVLNLTVPFGKVKFVIYDDRENSPTSGQFKEITISKKNYVRLTVQPGLWVGFKGIDNQENIILNIASIEHEPDEAENTLLNNLKYSW